MRVLVCSTSGAGHLGPLLPFARALRARGAEAVFVVPAAAAPSLEGWRVVVAGDPPASATGALWARVAAEPEAGARLVNGELFGALCTAAMLPAVECACDELAPALVLHEPCAYAAPIAAARRGIACAQAAISLAEVEAGSLAHAAPALERIEPGIVARVRAQPYLSRFPAALDRSPFADTRRYREAGRATARREPLPSRCPTGGLATSARSSTRRSARSPPAAPAPTPPTVRSPRRSRACRRGCC